MLNTEIVDFIHTELAKGLSKEKIKDNLLAGGYKVEEIDEALQSVLAAPTTVPSPNAPMIPAAGVPQPVATPQTARPAFSLPKIPKIAFIGIIVMVVMITGGSLLFVAGNKTDSAASTSTTSITTMPKQKVTNIPLTVRPREKLNLIIHATKDQEYRFYYIDSWKIASMGALTVLASPKNPTMQICDAVLTAITACDMLVSTVPYGSVTVLADGVTIGPIPTMPAVGDQVKSLAEQMTTGKEISPVLIATFTGYEAVSESEGKYVLNILLQGKKNMLLIQFPGVKSRRDLSHELQTMLLTITEK